MENEAKIIKMNKEESFMGNTTSQEATQNVNTDLLLTNKQEIPADYKVYYLDNPEDARLIKEYYMSKPNFRIIKLYDRYFLQYKTLKLHKAAYDVISEVVVYEKLVDDYYKENEKGFDSIQQATDSLTKYINAPQNAEIVEINVNANETIKNNI